MERPIRARRILGFDEASVAEQHLERWRRQAREARALAASFHNLEAKRQMLEIAAAYERMMSFTEERIRHLRPPEDKSKQAR